MGLAIETFHGAITAVLSAYSSLFGPHHQLLGLVLLSALAGLGVLWIFARTSDPAAIRRTRRLLAAYLLELRVYDDEPAVLWRAQRDLFLENLRYLRLMLRPALATTLPMFVLLLHLDRFYGQAPLAAGQPALVTLQMLDPVSASDPPPELQTPAGIAVETPPVRALSQRRVYWRIRPLQAVSGRLQVVFPWGVLEKTIEAGAPGRPVSSRRVRSLAGLCWNPGEPRLNTDAVAWMEVAYPPAAMTLAGWDLHWLLVFVGVSMVSAWLCKGRFGVAL